MKKGLTIFALTTILCGAAAITDVKHEAFAKSSSSSKGSSASSGGRGSSSKGGSSHSGGRSSSSKGSSAHSGSRSSSSKGSSTHSGSRSSSSKGTSASLGGKTSSSKGASASLGRKTSSSKGASVSLGGKTSSSKGTSVSLGRKTSNLKGNVSQKGQTNRNSKGKQVSINKKASTSAIQSTKKNNSVKVISKNKNRKLSNKAVSIKNKTAIKGTSKVNSLRKTNKINLTKKSVVPQKNLKLTNISKKYVTNKAVNAKTKIATPQEISKLPTIAIARYAIKTRTGAKLNQLHGHYCGPGHGDIVNGPKPVDALDALCRAHDIGYERKGYFNREVNNEFIKGVYRDAHKMSPQVREKAYYYAEGFKRMDKTPLQEGAKFGSFVSGKVKAAGAAISNAFKAVGNVFKSNTAPIGKGAL